jgi:hypothetical protein
MDGGGLVIDGGKVQSAWRRGQELFVAEAGQPESRIGTGMDVALAASHGKLFAVWNHAGVIESWSGDNPRTLSHSGAFPTIAALPAGGALAAWEENGKIEVSRIGK